MKSRLALFALVVVSALLSSGCYLRLLAITVGFSPGGYPSYTTEYTVSMGASSLVATCNDEEREDPLVVFAGCTYTITDDQGFLHDITSSFDFVTEFGVFGLLVDPLVLQLPQAVRVSSATLTSGAVPVQLVVTETGSFKAGPATIVTAEQGMKFAIVELPEGIAAGINSTSPRDGQAMDFQLTLSSTFLDFPVKTMFAVRIDTPGAKYYLPTLPCTTNFATIPAATLGFASALDPMKETRSMAEAYATRGCDGQVYDLRSPAPPFQASFRLFLAGVATD